MSITIPQNKIDEVRYATDIVDLVSGYVTLKKKGQNYFGLCPFHNEKTPSFGVNPEKEIFHCFGCGVGGNAFTFLMRCEGISFIEAVKMLAQKAGIELLLEEDDGDRQTAQQNEALYYVSEFAAKWYHELLFTRAGEAALAYLHKRGFDSGHIKKYELGYAPAAWDGLIQHATETANDPDKLLQAGLILKKEDGKRYDRFRDRIIFPIKNLSGRVVAFGGRVIKDASNTPKYLNSPETAIYEKGKILYGLYQSRDEIRRQDKAIFVEGYMDVLSLYTSGIQNVVATSGTALTQEQAVLIRRYTRNVVLMYDSDAAGSQATLRGADVLIENGLNVYVATLPEGHDPDSYVRQHGREAFNQYADQARNLFDFKIAGAMAQPPEHRRAAIQALLESAARVKDRIQRSLLVTTLAEGLHIPEPELWLELEPILRRAHRPVQSDGIADRLRSISRPTQQSKSDKAIEDLVRILLHDWALASTVFDALDLNRGREHPLYVVLEFMRNQYKGERQPTQEELLHRFEDIEVSAFIVRELTSEWEKVDMRKWAKDCLNTIQSECIQDEIAGLREELRQVKNNRERTESLLARLNQLEREKGALRGLQK